MISIFSKFKKVKIANENIDLLKLLKNEFDSIQLYKCTIFEIKDKTFVIESQTQADESVKQDETNKGTEDKSVHETVNEPDGGNQNERKETGEFQSEMASAIRGSELPREKQVLDKEEAPGMKANEEVEKSEEIRFKSTTIEPDTAADNNPPQKVGSDVEHNETDPLENVIHNRNTGPWQFIKLSKNSCIEYNGSSRDILKKINLLSHANIFRESLFFEYFGNLKKTFADIKDNQKQNLILMFVSLMLLLSLLLIFNFTLFLLICSTGLIAVKIYLKSREFKNTMPLKKTDNYFAGLEVEEPHKMIRITSIYNQDIKFLTKEISSFTHYHEWNKYLLGVVDFKREDNSAKLRYHKSLREDEIITQGCVDLKVKRKIHNCSSNFCVISERLVLGDNRHANIKVTTIEQSHKGKKCKVCVYLPLEIAIDKTVPATYIKSNMSSLDMLHFYIEHKNFNKEENYEEYIATEDIIPEQNEENCHLEHDKKLETPSLDIKHSITLTEDKPGDQVGVQNHRTTNSYDEFCGFDNRFSDARGNEEEVGDKEISVSRNSTVDKMKNSTEPTETEIESATVKDEFYSPDPNLQKENQQVRDLVTKKLEQLEAFLDKSWKSLDENKEYQLYYFDEPSGLRSIKSECVVDKNLKTVWEFITDVNQKYKYDKNFDCGHTIREINSTHSILYMKYKGKFTVSPRDFVIVSYKKFVKFI